MCVLIFSTNFVCSVSNSKKNSAIYLYYPVNSIPLKCHFVLLFFLWKLELYDRFSKNTEISNFMKICLVGTELFHAD